MDTRHFVDMSEIMQPKSANEFEDDEDLYIPEAPGKIKQFIRIPKKKIPAVGGVQAFDHVNALQDQGAGTKGTDTTEEPKTPELSKAEANAKKAFDDEVDATVAEALSRIHQRSVHPHAKLGYDNDTKEPIKVRTH